MVYAERVVFSPCLPSHFVYLLLPSFTPFALGVSIVLVSFILSCFPLYVL
jgi:hypothetical protein